MRAIRGIAVNSLSSGISSTGVVINSAYSSSRGGIYTVRPPDKMISFGIDSLMTSALAEASYYSTVAAVTDSISDDSNSSF